MSRSTCIKRIEAEGTNLLVTFPSGKTYTYENAGHLLGEAAVTESLGKWFNRRVKRGGFKTAQV